jgi:hypothetical protein
MWYVEGSSETTPRRKCPWGATKEIGLFEVYAYLRRHQNSAAAVRGSIAPHPGKPAVDDIGSTAAAVIWINIDGVNGAVVNTGAAFHAGVSVNDLGFVVPNSEDAVRTDQLTVTATDAFFL